MLSQQRIDYFLTTRNSKLSQDEYEELENEYFRTEKSDWYDKVKKEIIGEKNKEYLIWNSEKVEVFWKLIRRHPMIRGKGRFFDFTGYIFPPFHIVNKFSEPDNNSDQYTTFWNKESRREFQRKVLFKGVKFAGVVDLSKVVFQNELVFEYVRFHEEVHFKSSWFNQPVSFINGEFDKRVSLANCQFESKVTIRNIDFFDRVHFNHSIFRDITLFEDIISKDFIDFRNSSFDNAITIEDSSLKHIMFSGSKIHNSATFRRNQIDGAFNFNNAIFSEDHPIGFSYFKGSYRFSFAGVLFPKNTFFRNINFDHPSFFETNIGDCKFLDCNWGSTHRIKLKNGTEEVYRSLKKNFEETKHYAAAGKAYRSEMWVKQWKILLSTKLSKKPISWLSLIINPLEFLVYSIYGLFSGYTQSIIKPIIWFALFSLVFFPYVYAKYPSIIEDPIIFSLKNAMPFFKLNVDNQVFYPSLIQKTVSVTLLAFFVLALRKRFKQ